MSDGQDIEERINQLRKRVEEVAVKDMAAAAEYAVRNFGSNYDPVAIKAFLAGVRHGRSPRQLVRDDALPRERPS